MNELAAWLGGGGGYLGHLHTSAGNNHSPPIFCLEFSKSNRSPKFLDTKTPTVQVFKGEGGKTRGRRAQLWLTIVH